jgi:hypothetical protein
MDGYNMAWRSLLCSTLVRGMNAEWDSWERMSSGLFAKPEEAMSGWWWLLVVVVVMGGWFMS